MSELAQNPHPADTVAPTGPDEDSTASAGTVALVTLGCARNDVDSEELAARLEEDGFRLVDEPADAETVVVNTCGFVEAAKKDSIDTLLQAADQKADTEPAADTGSSAGTSTR